MNGADEDWTSLNETKDRQLFLDTSGGVGIITIVNYISKKSGIEFKSLEEIENWISDHSLEWDNSPQYITLTARLEELSKDLMALDKMKEFGASDDLVSSLKETYKNRQDELRRLEEQAKNSRNSWKQNLQTINMIRNAKKTYERFKSVKLDTDERKSALTEFPILFYLRTSESIEVFMPSFSTQDSLSHRIRHKVSQFGEVIEIRDYSSSRTNEENDFKNYAVLEMKIPTEKLEELVLSKDHILFEDPVINSLGIKITKKILIDNNGLC